MARNKLGYFLLAVAFATMAFTFSCSEDRQAIDDYNGATCSADFSKVQIGTQTWMAENLNCDVEGSKCYNNDPSYCNIYGRLYNWATAMNLPLSCNSSSCSNKIQSKHRGICPAGWHIPSKADWETLMAYMAYMGGGNGTNDYGFNALPSGFGLLGGFYDVGMGSWWWTASEDDSDYNAYYLSGDMDYSLKTMLFSVRCLKD